MKSKTLGSHLTAISLLRHINNICRSASRSIHHIGKIRKFVNRSATERLILAFVSSKLDYSNSILLGLPSYELEKLQRLQNITATLTVRAKKSATSFPGPLSFSSLVVEERDPGCGWSRVYVYKSKPHQGWVLN